MFRLLLYCLNSKYYIISEFLVKLGKSQKQILVCLPNQRTRKKSKFKPLILIDRSLEVCYLFSYFISMFLAKKLLVFELAIPKATSGTF